MLTILEARYLEVAFESSLQVILKAEGFSIKLVISLNLIPAIGKLSTVLIYSFNLNLSVIYNFGRPEWTRTIDLCNVNAAL